MSPTIRTVVIPVSDLEAAKAVYTALLDAPHTDEAYYVGYDVNGFEVGLAPDDPAGGPVAYADVEDLDATRASLLALVRPSAVPHVKSRPRCGSACSPTPTATRSAYAAGSGSWRGPPPSREGELNDAASSPQADGEAERRAVPDDIGQDEDRRYVPPGQSRASDLTPRRRFAPARASRPPITRARVERALGKPGAARSL